MNSFDHQNPNYISTFSPPTLKGHTGAYEPVDLACTQFREFYKVISSSAKAASLVSEKNALSTVQELSQKLCMMIETQALDLNHYGQFNLETQYASRYLKAALADEILLNTQWEGRKYWGQYLVETTLFQTSYAGEKVFNDLQALLENQETSNRTSAILHLYVLSLGFEGRYRGTPQIGQIAEYRRQLFQFAYQKVANLEGREKNLSQQPYLSTLKNFPKQKTSRLSQGNKYFIIIMLILLTISEFIWLLESWPVRRILNGIASSFIFEISIG